MTRRLALALAVFTCTPSVTLGQSPGGAGDAGRWEPPFNHVVPLDWELGQPGWDGEYLSSHADPADPHRFMVGQAALIPVGPLRGWVLALNQMDVISGEQHWSIVDPDSFAPTFLNFELPMPSAGSHLFCSGHAWTRDGHLLLAGGNEHKPLPIGKTVVAARLCYRFDPTAPVGNDMWVREPDLFVARWYPTVTALGSDEGGRDLLLVSAGSQPAFTVQSPAMTTYQAFDPTAPPGSGSWRSNPGDALGAPLFDGPDVPCPDQPRVYPRQVLLASGRVFRAGISELGSRLEHFDVTLDRPPIWEVQALNPLFSRKYGSVVLVPNPDRPHGFPDVVMRIGGGVQPWDYGTCQPQPEQPTETTEYCFADLDAHDPGWLWRRGPSLAHARDDPDATLLPDGTVLVTGGRLDTDQYGAYYPVYEAELFDDVPFAWRTLARAAVRRGHHSVALLLPSGKVLTAGGEGREMDYEVFQPPYLTNGTVRPVVANAPDTLVMRYGETYGLDHLALPAGVEVERVVLMAPGSVMHGFDMHQRYVELALPHPPRPTRVLFEAPPNSNRIPRGYHMLFLVTNPQPGSHRGTPSEATWVKLE